MQESEESWIDVDPHGVLTKKSRKLQRAPAGWSISELDPIHFIDDQSPYSMTRRQLAWRASKVNRGRFWHQFFLCFTVTLGSTLAGYTVGVVYPMIRQNYNRVGKSVHHPQFASIVTGGMAAGVVFMSMASLARGPRRIMLMSAPFNALCWLLLVVVGTDGVTEASMFFCSMFSMLYLRSGALLLLDSIHESYYYIFYLIFYTGYGFGVFLGRLVGLHSLLQLFDDYFAVALLLLFFILLILCPESPICLYKISPVKAQKALIFVRGTEDIQVLMRQIHKDYESRILTISTKYMFLYRVVYKSIIIILSLSILQCFYAYNIFLVYEVNLWYAQERPDIIGEYQDGVIIGAAYFVVPAISNAINLRMAWGLRRPILASAYTVPVTLLAHCLFYYYLFNTNYLDSCRWLSFVVRISHIICVNFSHNWALDVMIADYLPEQVHVWVIIGVYFVKYCVTSIMFCLTFVFEDIVGTTAIIAFLTAVSFVGIPFCYYFIIESKGRTLQQVQMAVGGNPIGTRNSFRNGYQRYLAEQKRKKQLERAEKEYSISF